MKDGMRLHSMDALRAVMMWLGIVLHSAMVYMEPGIEMHRSPETSLIATSLFGWIHIYRMPLFFMLAGFFTCMLVEQRGNIATLHHRAKRIALPFLVFWPVLFVLINITIEAHAQRLDPSSPGISFRWTNWIVTTGHLWFLYYLILFTPFVIISTRMLKLVLPAMWQKQWVDAAALVIRSWWGPVLLALPAALLSSGYPASIMTGDGAFVPVLSSICYYLMFYVTGWVLYARFDQISAQHKRRWRLYLVTATLAFFGANILGFMALGLFGEEYLRADIDFAFRTAYSIAVWLWCGFFLGVFLKFYRHESALHRYLSDSSYWVYLSHYPIVLVLAYALYSVTLPALVKMSILIALTTLSCLTSYHFFIRRSWIGQLLNGHRGQAGSIQHPAVSNYSG